MKLYRFSPIKSNEVTNVLKYVHLASNKLCQSVLGEYQPPLGNIVIFTHYDDEYRSLATLQKLLVSEENVDQKYYKLKEPIMFPDNDGIPGSSYSYLYIRPPDPWRSQVGDLDVFLDPDRYKHLKQELESGAKKKGMRVFPRADLDMIELFDPDVDVLTYVRPEKLEV